MGNCQAADAAATVVIQHPGGRVDRIQSSTNASEVMKGNPGYYVARVVATGMVAAENAAPIKQLKLLRPEDTLVIGQIYRLVSCEDVLKAKKRVKLGK